MKHLRIVVAVMAALAMAVPAGPQDAAPAAPVTELESRAAAGDAEAQFDLGLLYIRGEGVAEDHAAAASWFRKAADLGQRDAQYLFGLMHISGQGGVEKSNSAAYKLLLKSAEQGLPDAQSAVGEMLFAGQGARKDEKAGSGWFTRAARQGDADAQMTLSTVLFKKKDFAGAYRWNAIAGRDDAEHASTLVIYTPFLSAQQRAKLDAEAAAWRPTPEPPPTQKEKAG
jgi:uncharacterized protein